MMAKVKLSRGTIRLLWGIPLTAVLMAGLTLVLVYSYIRHGTILLGYAQLWQPCLYFVGTALGGSLGVRIALLSWRQVILSSLLAGVGLILCKGSIIALLPWSSQYFGIPIYRIVPFFLILIAAGAFLLPLFDPAVRKSGPIPSPWKVALVAFLPILILILSGVLHHNAYAVVFFGILPAGLGILIGLILTLANQTHVGAWVGGLAVLFQLWISAISLLGYPF